MIKFNLSYIILINIIIGRNIVSAEKRWNYLWEKLIEHVTQAVKKYHRNDVGYKQHVTHIPMIVEEIKDIKTSC